MIASAVDCCVLWQDRPWFVPSMPRALKQHCCVSSLSLPPNSWLLHPQSMDGRLIAHLIDVYGGRGRLFYRSPLPRSTSCADEHQLKAAIAPSSCCRGGCFISPTAKLTASRATEARRGGISNGVVWLLWPLSDDLGAIGHGLGGRSVMDGCVEKFSTFVRTLTKIRCSRSSLF
jgi:hypothetical protein